jgi:hypothetical protein
MRKSLRMKFIQRLKVGWISFAAVTILAGSLLASERMADPTDAAAEASTQATKAADPWGPCRFLLGDWVAIGGSGQPGEALSGSTSFAFDLENQVLVRRNRADYAPQPGDHQGISHQDLLILYLPLGETQPRAFYIDNEGHAINYQVTFPKDGAAVFESDASPKGPRYRLEYQLNADRTVTITFAIAMAGGDYQVYTTGSARRKQI